MAEDDLVYLLRRAAKESTLAEEAKNSEARAAHRGLAEAYAERARSMDDAHRPARAGVLLR